MTGTNHGMTGALIALVVKEPVLAIPLSYLSHFACDVIPHFGVNRNQLFSRRFNIILVTDFIVAVSMMITLGILFPKQRLLIWACMIAAASPDLTWAYYDLYKSRIKGENPKLDKLTRIHFDIQWFQKPIGAFVEVAWFISMWTLILTYR